MTDCEDSDPVCSAGSRRQRGHHGRGEDRFHKKFTPHTFRTVCTTLMRNQGMKQHVHQYIRGDANSDTMDIFPSMYLFALGGGGILLGAWIRGPRLVQAVSNEYASLGPRRSIAALIPAFLIAQLAIVLGIPISFNKVMIASIVGSGLAAESSGGSGIALQKVGYTVGSWVGSMLGAGVISFGLYRLLTGISGVG